MWKQGKQKLQRRYFRPFKVLERVGYVAYKLDLPETALIHPMIHISQVKRTRAPGGPSISIHEARGSHPTTRPGSKYGSQR